MGKIKKNNNPSEHTWRFFRAGGFDQVRIDTAKDLLNIGSLDQKLWAALSCPVDNVHLDPATLSFIDIDGDRRIRANELIAAINWAGNLLSNPDELIQSSDSITISSIRNETEDGKKLIETVRDSLKILGKGESASVSISELESLQKSFSGKLFNGDGIITTDTTSDDSLKTLIGEIINICGSALDRSGNPGIDAGIIEDFFSKAQQYLDWKNRVLSDKQLQPLQEKTYEALNTLLKVKVKIDDYFARCAIAEYDERSVVHLNGNETELLSCSLQTISIDCEQFKNLPIAQIKPCRPLPLKEGINPAWYNQIQEFNINVVEPVLGTKDSLTLKDWKQILDFFAPVLAHYESKPVTSIDTIDSNRLKEILDSTAKQELLTLVEKDSYESVTFDTILMLDKLLHFKRDLYSLCLNFVNFRDFYSKGTLAIFQAGTLFIDQRSCKLCIKINDVNKHSLMAAMAGTYLVYCECRRKDEPQSITIVAAFTNGDSDNLIVGRNGIFYDRNGKDWDATIIKIISNPISLREAFWLPYKSFVRMIESQIAKRAADAETQSTNKLTEAAISTVNIDKSKAGQAETPKKFDIGIIAALGVAAGALGTFAATLFGYMAGIIKLGPLAVIGAVIGLFSLISGPSLILAFIKLRKRNLGPILDASGWAVNAKARISVPFGAILTHTAVLPPGSQRDLIDPYAEKKSPWPRIVLILIIGYLAYTLLNHFGFINQWSKGMIGVKKEIIFQPPK